MTNQERNDYFYVCALIEYISRATRNHRGDVVRTIGKEGIEKLLYDAQVNHCLSFEQVSDEVIEYYKIKEGTLTPFLTVIMMFPAILISENFTVL